MSDPEPTTDPRARLLQLRADLVAESDDTHRALQEIRRLRLDRSDDDEHDPEGAPLSGEWFRVDGLHTAARQRVRDVDEALADLDAGRYGSCRRCGEPIAPGRLEIMPTATRCVRCAGKP
ncbi:TraR/DksA C4-type zinc finger protein [Nakamurella flavida]|uniref:TraR/DksA C4-type zinc finger protein n=1 Tax=Nakamurella flavida TaxID=363630 RepID=A0A938YIK5_9ACTN|nr:TraR/DksA C4-type zinc finger protein [Nakamurella flavida]MBM9476617.1 TraR/DksA C4-type zinc finger protein [Nakamurella flavida]MDP9778945.1 RNA polymerase-binding transcription factor DksA [Nakamurella flavida]